MDGKPVRFVDDQERRRVEDHNECIQYTPILTPKNRSLAWAEIWVTG